VTVSGVILWIVGLLVAQQVFGLAVTVGFHRLLAHRAFKTTAVVRGALALLGAQYAGSPMLWVAVHRVHHFSSDYEEDPHTPNKGFWYAHCGWLISTANPVLCAVFAASGFGLMIRFVVYDIARIVGVQPPSHRRVTRDLERERLMRILDVPLLVPIMFAGQVALAWWLGGWWGIAWLWSAHVWLNNTTWVVNSVCHWPSMGSAPYDAEDGSRNVRWLAWLTYGESNHNSHHKFPRSARHGLDGEPDESWRVIELLERAHLVWDVHLPDR
jgi:stearoyl-CoA desaturase (delta-9 desaturase)